MFGFKKKKIKNESPRDVQPNDNYMVPVTIRSDEDIMNKDIFSADDAINMGLEFKNKKRNDDRREIFRQIKAHIQDGNNQANVHNYLFDNGNSTYFEGLGYKIKPVWQDSHSGLFLSEKPEVETIPTFQQDLIGYPIRRSYYPYQQISWE